MAQLDEFRPQILIVIDLAVKHQHQGLVLVKEGLRGALYVNNAQTAKAHGNALVGVITVRVGAAVGDDLGHLPQILLAVNQLTGKAAKSAHTLAPFLCPKLCVGCEKPTPIMRRQSPQ